MQGSTVLNDIYFAEQLPELKFLNIIRELVLGIFILAYLVYHKISISSLYGFDCGDLIIPKIGCCFYVKVKASIYHIILSKNSRFYARIQLIRRF